MKIFLLTILLLELYQENTMQITQVDKRAKVAFKIKNMGVFVKGEFTDFKFDSHFNNESLNSSFINADIQVSSLDTGNSKRDKDLKKEKYFDLDQFPNIKFTSARIDKLTENSYRLEGNLTIKNVSKKIIIPLEIDTKNHLTANFELNRLDYKVGSKSWIMSDEVIIEVFCQLQN